MSKKPAVLVTGASAGIGAVYAERFAARGHDLVLVARNGQRMSALANRLKKESGVDVDVMTADLTAPEDLAKVGQRLREDDRIGVLVNNAGTAVPKGFVGLSNEETTKLIALNVTAVTALAQAAAGRFSEAGEGAIVNIASVVGFAPELGMTIYGATKAFVLYLSQGLALELGPKGVYVQAVLPAATRTEIWERTNIDVSTLQGVMEVGELVDAALTGFDRREPVTIPPLPDAAQWSAFEAARQAMLPNLAQAHAAPRYRVAS